MTSSKPITLLAILATLLSCGGERVAPVPQIGAVTPERAFNDEPIAVTLTGEFPARATQHLSGDEPISVSTSYSARVGSVALEEVQWVDAKTLRGSLPSGLTPGRHDVEVTNPWNASGRAEGLFEAVDRGPPVLMGVARVEPSEVKVGETLRVILDVRNEGLVDALKVTPSPLTISDGAAVVVAQAPTPVDIKSGATATFEWKLVGLAPAEHAAEVTATATSARTGAGVMMARVTSPSFAFRVPPVLTATAAFDVERASVGQTVTLEVDVTNIGLGPVVSFLPSAVPTVPGRLQALTDPSPRDLAVGATATFRWTYEAIAEGSVGAIVDGQGVDPSRNLPIAMPTLTAAPVQIDRAAALTTVVTAIPAQVSLGQQIAVTVVVTNTGGAMTSQVLLSALQLSGSGAATVTASPSQARDIPSGGTATFTFGLQATAAGTLRFGASATGTDANSGLPVSSAAAASADIILQTPATLEVTSFTAPSRVSRGQAFLVALTVANTGQAAAVGVLPSPLPPAASVTGGAAISTSTVLTAVTIQGGASHTFTWSYDEQGMGPGTFSLSASVLGEDANSSQSISTTSLSTPATLVQVPASLSITSFVVPPKINRGSTFTATVTVLNSGEATATAVVPAPLTPTLSATGGANASVGTPATAVTITGGASATFSWTLTETGTASGTLQLAVGISGVDDNSQSPLTVAAQQSAVISVQRPAALTISSMSLPMFITRGQSFSLTLVVQNTGEATLRNVAPQPPQLTATGGAGASTGTSITPVDLPGGASASFSWSYLENGTTTGTLSFATSVVGTDENSTATVTAPQATSNTANVLLPTGLQILSFAGPPAASRGQTFTLSMTVRNNGGDPLNDVRPTNLPPTLSATGGASANTTSSPPGVTIAAGATATFSWTYAEGGSGPGSLSFSSGASGTDSVTGATVSASTNNSNTVLVQQPAQLVVTSFAVPASLSRGQSFIATMVVTNTGGAIATGVIANPTPPTVSTTGGANATTTTTVTARTLAPGASTTFTWSYIESGTGIGTLGLTSGASGTDSNSGAAVTAAATSNTANVEAPAQLSIISFTLPTRLSRGQSFSAVLVIRNTGGANATAVAPSAPVKTLTGGANATTTTTHSAVNLAPNALATFTWTYVENGSAPGTLRLSATVSGADANSGAALSTPTASSGTAVVETPGALNISAFSLPDTLSRGQAFTATMTVMNTGQAAVNAVLPTPNPPNTALTGGADATLATPPTSVVIPGGGSHSFAFNYVENGSGIGTLAASAAAAGTDANSGLSVTSPVRSSNTATVQSVAALSGVLTLPAIIDQGTVFNVQLTVTNNGQATANLIGPSALTRSGTATVTQSSGPTPATLSLAGGATGVFVWSYTANSVGSLQLSGSAAGSDGNSAATVSTGAMTSNPSTVADSVRLLVANPFSTPTTFAHVFRFAGRVYLSPRSTGDGAVRMNADGSGLESVSFSFARDNSGTNQSSNTSAAPYPSVGYSTCTANTATCGPDNESGRALFASGSFAGGEWLFSGGMKPAGNLDYAYLTRDTGTLASFAFVDLDGLMNGSTLSFSAAHFFNNRLYLGAPDSSGNRPDFLKVVTPPAAPGLNAAAGTDALSMGAAQMPGIGKSAPVSLIDVIADFNNRLYIANNGGCMRSLNNDPTSGSEWTRCTPSAVAYASRTSIETSKRGEYEPADKSVPAFAAFNGALYMARNTTAGPQLWRCVPSTTAEAASCDPGDWALVASNSSGDPQLSQFNNPNNTRIALLQATTSNLYVGFNNAVDGVVLFRSAVASPTSRADFLGANECSAALHPSTCQGRVGNGFGSPATNQRFFDAVVTSFNGRSYVYFTVGNGGSNVQLFRATP